MSQNCEFSGTKITERPVPKNGQNEELRAIIRSKIHEKLRAYDNIEMSEDMRKQLREEIRREVSIELLSQTKHAKKPGIGSVVKKSYESVLNFVNPGPSYHQIDNDDDRAFQEQMRIAMELSKAEIKSSGQEDLGAVALNGTDVGTDNVEEDDLCGICFEPATIKLSYGCDHEFCVDCIETNLSTAIKEGLIESMKCPEPKCDFIATQHLVKKVVSNELFERYEVLLLKAAVGSLDDIVYCPIEECGAIIEAEADIGIAQCYKCGHTFCTNCSKPYHGTSDCELTEDERKQCLQKYQDELIAEKWLAEETQNQLAIEAMQREDEEWLKRIVEEQQTIRSQEESEKQEFERQQIEIRRLEEERASAEAQQREREKQEHERMVRDREEREKAEKAVLEERRQQERESENTVKNTSKPCPSCKAPIEKNGGCIHITFSKCKFEFCFQCLNHWPAQGHSWVHPGCANLA